MDRVVKLSVIISALVVGLSTAYYLVVYIPQRDRAKLEQQNQQAQEQAQLRKINADNLENCLDKEQKTYSQAANGLAGLKRQGNNFDLESSLNSADKDYQIKKADCFKKFPQ